MTRSRHIWRTGVFLTVITLTSLVSAAEVTPSILGIERFAAERGDASAQFAMGEHYELGDSGVQKDLAMALAFYRKAAAQAHGPAQFQIGMFHERGLAGQKKDMTKAVEWYESAAKNGSALARQRLDDIQKAKEKEDANRAEQEARAREAQEQRKQLAEKKIRPPAPAPIPTTRAIPPTPAKETTAPARTPAHTLDTEQLLAHVLGGKWSESGRSAEFLPAADMGCLQTAPTEITCFSKERKRVVSGKKAVHSVKSVLSRFSDTGTFDVHYTYHVSTLEEAAAAPSPDDSGLLPALGWQQPGVTGRCKLKTPALIECVALNKTREIRAQ